MSATRYGSQANKRTPQPKAEASSSFKGAGTSRGSNAGVSVERNRNEQVRGNQGAAGSESSSSAVADKKKGSASKPGRKLADKDGSGSQWNNHKNKSRDVGWVRTLSPNTSSAPVMATRGISSNALTTSSTHHKTDPTSSEGKQVQSHPTKAKTSAKQSSSSSRGHRSNHTSECRHARASSPPVSNAVNETNYPSLSSTKMPSDSIWSKTIYPNASDKTQPSNNAVPPASAAPSNLSSDQKPVYEDREEFLWSASQDSDSGDWSNEADLENQLLQSSSTDDEKIRSKCMCSIIRNSLNPDLLHYSTEVMVLIMVNWPFALFH